MAPALSIENLCKRFRIDHTVGPRPTYRTLREDLTALFGAPWRWLRHGRPTTTREDFWALNDVSFAVRSGEIVGIIGRNGAGKSTLLKIMSNITKPTSGRVRIRGRSSSLLEVGTGFHPELTGRENIYLSGAILGMRRAEIRAKFDEIVAFAEGERFLDTPVKRYSSGMYVRLAFAVAAHLEPEVLLIDEVLAVGDVAFQKKCLSRIRESARAQGIVLFVSHNMPAVLSICDRVIWLDGGKVRADGDPRAVVNDYLSSGAANQTARSWEDRETAPGNENVRLRRVAVSAPGQSDEEPFTVQTPLQVEVDFWNFLDGAILNLAAVVYEVERGCIFVTFSPLRACPSGLVQQSFVIPANLLNDGMYSVALYIIRDGMLTLYDVHDLLVFQVHDVERRKGYMGPWSGAVRPALEWKVAMQPFEDRPGLLAG
jgi:lipopolysaccharide transport system ATP-binding protein